MTFETVDQIKMGIKLAVIKQHTNVGEAAIKAGVTGSNIYRFLNGNDIRLSTLDKFATRGLNMTIVELARLGS